MIVTILDNNYMNYNNSIQNYSPPPSPLSYSSFSPIDYNLKPQILTHKQRDQEHHDNNNDYDKQDYQNFEIIVKCMYLAVSHIFGN